MVAQEKLHEAAEADAPDISLVVEVSLEDYLEHYAEQHYEWVEGVAIKLSPATLKHNKLAQYLYALLDIYFSLNAIGEVVSSPFVVRLPEFPRRRREPDLLVVLESNPNELKETYMDGAPDICIEIVSEESTGRDHGDKFAEYETGGVAEYWILDVVRNESRFYRLNAEKRYVRQDEDADGNYRTPALPGLRLHVPTLWQDKLPDILTTMNAVKTMLDA